jgi:hypothetical protein
MAEGVGSNLRHTIASHLMLRSSPEALRDQFGQSLDKDNAMWNLSRRSTIAAAIGMLLIGHPLLFSQTNDDILISSSGLQPWSAIHRSGHMNVVWVTLSHGVHLATLDSSGRLSPDSILFQYSNTARFPRVNTSGAFGCIAWQSSVNPFKGLIEGFICPIDSLDRTTFVEYSNELDEVPDRGQPDVSFLEDTIAAVVWHGNGSETPLRSAVYGQFVAGAGNKIGRNFIVSDHVADSVDCVRPRIVSNPRHSSFVVTWVDNSQGRNLLFGRRIDRSGQGLGSSFLISDDLYMTGMWYYSVANDSHGNFVTVWIADSSNLSRIVWRWFDSAGVALTGVQALTEFDSRFDSGSSIDCAIDQQGRMVLVWEQRENGKWRIFGRKFGADRTPLGQLFRVSNDTSSCNEIFPRVLFRNDRVWTVWEKSGARGTEIWGNIKAFDWIGSSTVDPGLVPQRRDFVLYRCFPNPFNLSTAISIRLDKMTHATLTIHNLLGQSVADLIDERMDAGTYIFHWDGKDNYGRVLPTGAYFVRLSTSQGVLIQKCVLLK